MCLFRKIKHSFTLCLSTLHLSLVPERSVFFYHCYVKKYIKFLCCTSKSSVNFKKRQSVSLWNFLVNTLLLYIPLLTLTDGQKDRQRPNTLATHGLEEHFSSCAVVSVFWLWRKQFQVILTYHTSCAVVSIFLLRWEIVFGSTGRLFGCGGKKFQVLLLYLPYLLYRCVSFLVVAENSFWLLGF